MNKEKNIGDIVEEIKKDSVEFAETIEENIEDLASEEQETIKKITDDLKKGVDFIMTSVTKTIKDLQEDEQLKENLHQAKGKAIALFEETKEKIITIREDEEWQKRWSDLVANTSLVVAKVANFAEETSAKAMDKAKENEKFAEYMDKATDVASKAAHATKETYVATKEKVDDYFAKPEVIEKIDAAKDKTIDVAEKAVDGLKKWLKPEGKESTEPEETTEK